MNAATPVQTGISTAGFTQADVYDYARSVRAQLTDLGPNVVSELTGGLEGDLSEALLDPSYAERSSLADIFGSPTAYADELRQAAGLPLATGSVGKSAKRRAKAGHRRRAIRRPEFGRVRQGWQRTWAPITGTAEWQRFRNWCHELAPAWWVIRGWLVGSFLSTVGNNNTLGGPRLMPRFGLELLLTLAITVLSVQWGRGRWFVWPWLRRLATVMSILAVWFGLVFALNGSTTSWGGPRDWDTGYYQGQQDALRLVNGVWVNGEPVINIFAYDAAGNPIPVVQLFDERGRPISLRNSEDDGGGYLDASTGQFWRRLPRSSADGRLWWNTFPQIEVPEDQLTWDDEGNRLPLSAGQAREPQWPFLRATRVDSGRDVDDFSPIGG